MIATISREEMLANWSGEKEISAILPKLKIPSSTMSAKQDASVPNIMRRMKGIVMLRDP